MFSHSRFQSIAEGDAVPSVDLCLCDTDCRWLLSKLDERKHVVEIPSSNRRSTTRRKRNRTRSRTRRERSRTRSRTWRKGWPENRF